jgi:hypothetical protein
MSITTINDLVAGLAVGQTSWTSKTMSVPKAVGNFQSSWIAVGYPGAGNTPPVYTVGSGYTSDRTTAGALPYTNAVTQNWLAKWFMSSSIAGTLMLVDRLWSCSGMGFAASTYTVTTPGALPARITDNGIGCQLWVENYIAAGVSTGTLVANYVNPSAGAESGTIPVVVNAPVIGQMQPVPLAVGATGVKQLTSVVTNATWTSGTFGMTILKPIAAATVQVAGAGVVLDWASLGIPQIPPDACLMWIWQGAAATANQIISKTEIIDK